MAQLTGMPSQKKKKKLTGVLQRRAVQFLCCVCYTTQGSSYKGQGAGLVQGQGGASGGGVHVGRACVV